MLWRWLIGAGGERAVYVADWTPQRAAQAYRDTERLLLGACGPVRVVGDRVVEAREQRVQAMRRGTLLRMVR